MESLYERPDEINPGEPDNYDAALPGRLSVKCPRSDRDNVYRDWSGEREVRPDAGDP